MKQHGAGDTAQPPRAVFDTGLQPERTALSWQRTGLAILAGSLVGIRVLVPDIGWVGVLVGSAGALLGLTVFVWSSRRHRTVHDTLMRNSLLRNTLMRNSPESTTRVESDVARQLVLLPGAALMAVVAAASVIAGLIALVYVLTR